MAEKIIKMRSKLAGPLLPAVAPVAKMQQQARVFLLPLPAVQLVSLWGLFNAGFVTFVLALTFAITVIFPCPHSCLAPPLDPTDAAEQAKVDALLLGALWCTVAQAAAATPALLLAARRRWIRLSLAYVVLAAAVASHCMFVSGGDLYRATGPGYPVVIRINCSIIIFFLAAGDLLCFLALVVGSHE